MTENQEKIMQVGIAHTTFLLKKNAMYGDSALNPIGIFSKHIDKNKEALSGMLIRCDDKLKRIQNADSLRKNDICDLIGYLKLICIDQDWLDFDDLLD